MLIFLKHARHKTSFGDFSPRKGIFSVTCNFLSFLEILEKRIELEEKIWHTELNKKRNEERT